MSSNERIDTILRFGYTEREARFLERVALHSGYFLRRQYNQFLGQKRGGTAAALIKKLLAKGQVRVESSCDRTPIYHLNRHSLYELIGEPNNRHRRRRGTIGIALKVMALDVILQRSGVCWLGTEAEKRAFFEMKLSIPSPFLPSRNSGSYGAFRYFVDKTPIGYEQKPDQVASPVVSFAYVDPGASTIGFETFLNRNQLLFACLPRLRVLYASPLRARFGLARQTFRAFEQDLTTRRQGIVKVRIHQLTRLLNLEHELPQDERNALRKEFDPAELRWLIKLRAQQTEWNIRELLRPKGAFGPYEACFTTLHLDHDYSLFGLL